MKKFLRLFLIPLLTFLSVVSFTYAAISIVPNGGTGVGTITGIIQGNGTSPFSAVTIGTGLSLSGGTLSNTSTGGIPGGFNTQLQYNNAGVFGGIIGAVTDGTSVSLTTPHFLNPTINGAGTGLVTLAYPNTSISGTLTLPAVTDTVAVLGTAQTFTAPQTFGNGNLIIAGAGTGTTTLEYSNTASSGGVFLLPTTSSGQTLAILGTQTFTGTETFSGSVQMNGVTGNFGSSVLNSTYQLGYGASTSGVTKTINIGTGGLSGSITNISIGSAVSGALGGVTINSLTTGLVKSTSGILSNATAGTDFLASVNTNSTLTGAGTTASALGINLSNANTWTGAQLFVDGTSGFTLYNSADNTKTATFNLASLSTGTAQVITLPNATGATMATTNLSQTFSNTQTFSGNVTMTTGTLTIGNSTGTQNVSIMNAVTGAATKTLNLATGGGASSTTAINIGSASGTNNITFNNLGSGLLKTTSGLLSNATAGTDYIVPTSAFTTGSVAFAGASNQLTQDNSNFFYNSTNHQIGFGTIAPTNTITLGSTGTGLALYNTSDQTTNFEEGLLSWSGNVLSLRTSFGGTGTARNLSIGTTNRTFTIVDGASTSGFYQWNSGSGTANAVGSNFAGTWNASSGVNPVVAISPTLTQTGTAGYTALQINATESTVGSGAKSLITGIVSTVQKFVIDDLGNFTTVGSILSSGGAVGYTTGTGGTVTQVTSKSTGVTLNTYSGIITMNNAALSSATIASFTVTDSKMTATDVVVIQHDSGGTLGVYTIDPSTSAAGSFVVNVRNDGTVPLSEALVLRFAIIKGSVN